MIKENCNQFLVIIQVEFFIRKTFIQTTVVSFIKILLWPLHLVSKEPICSLQLFYTSDNYTVDIMHNLLEGVVQYELKLVFQYLIKNSISLSSLSERVMSFNYEYTQINNRPSGLKQQKSWP